MKTLCLIEPKRKAEVQLLSSSAYNEKGLRAVRSYDSAQARDTDLELLWECR